MKSFVNEHEIAGAADMSSFGLIPSGPDAFEVSRLERISRTSLSVVCIKSRPGNKGSAISGKVAEVVYI